MDLCFVLVEYGQRMKEDDTYVTPCKIQLYFGCEVAYFDHKFAKNNVTISE